MIKHKKLSCISWAKIGLFNIYCRAHGSIATQNNFLGTKIYGNCCDILLKTKHVLYISSYELDLPTFFAEKMMRATLEL